MNKSRSTNTLKFKHCLYIIYMYMKTIAIQRQDWWSQELQYIRNRHDTYYIVRLLTTS